MTKGQFVANLRSVSLEGGRILICIGSRMDFDFMIENVIMIIIDKNGKKVFCSGLFFLDPKEDEPGIVSIRPMNRNETSFVDVKIEPGQKIIILANGIGRKTFIVT